MNNKSKQKFLRVDRKFFDLPEVEYTIEHLKGIGLAMVVLLLERLPYRTHTIGLIANLGALALKLGVQKRTLLSMLCRCPVFKVDVKRGIFYAPRLRRKYKLASDPTDDEVNDVLHAGNIYFGDAENGAKAKGSSANISKPFSKRSSKSASQHADNQQKQTSKTYKDIDISKRNIKVESNSACAGDRPCHDDADDKEFKEILSSARWRRSVANRTGVSLDDDATLTAFASWMCSYCISMQKHLADAADVRNYAANLLRPGTKTRTEFDNYVAERKHDEPPVYAEPPHSEFEFIYHGMRYTKQGQLIPIDAPMPTSNSQWFSYIKNRWVERAEYQEDVENAAFERIVKDNPGYVCRTGGASC